MYYGCTMGSSWSLFSFLSYSYSQELPSRCKKEIVHAADVNKDGRIDEEHLSQIISNIGAEESVSKQDLRNILKEVGDSRSHTISLQDMFNIL